MEHGPRIPLNPVKCKNFMILTDEKQKSVLTPPSTLRYTLYGWTFEESQAWSAFRKRIETLFALYFDPAKTGPAVRKKMKNLIAEIRRYDNDKTNGHHLLDKVALFGNDHDWFSFNVKRGTPLASGPTHHDKSPVNTLPTIFLKENSLGSHWLVVKNSETLHSRKLPEGMAFAKVFCAIGSVEPAGFSKYDLLGNAKRGNYINHLSHIEQDAQTRMFAWYYACYESKNGELGPPGNIIRVEIMLMNY